jgi:hypothetical protein
LQGQCTAAEGRTFSTQRLRKLVLKDITIDRSQGHFPLATYSCIIEVPANTAAAQPNGMVTMMSSLRFASSVKLMVPDHVPAKRSAGFSGSEGAHALISRLISKTNETKKHFVFMVALFFYRMYLIGFLTDVNIYYVHFDAL